ncbi:phage tail protein [Altericroceibacterium spongiae]|uniref:phage tail protein n=1 Tax=Altericroceibacterium spongiae TaxID=2320269 RepID=UPI00160403F2|nr:phage tail protein [Altericroceibacterium spongiae]
MSKVSRFVGQVAGVVAGAALIGSGIGAAVGAPLAISGIGSAASIAQVAGAVSAVASIGTALTSEPARAQGQVNDRIIGANNPQPYLIGRTYSGGVQVHDVGYGGNVDDVDNPYRFIPVVYSCCGPVQGLESVQLDFEAVSFSGTSALGYYSDYFWRDYQLGARPEADALAPHFAGAPDWGSAHKLSSFAAIGYSLKWSKKGKRFAGGQLPVIGAIWQGVKVYDPRLDSTFPGGSGTCRAGDESTYVYQANPATHSGTYAYGRYVNGVKVFGVDLGAAGVNFADVAAWANVCDANGWTVNGTIYEPGDKWNNLKRIAEAGAGFPVLVGGKLGFDYRAPRASLYTITRDDLADGVISSQLNKEWKSRHNVLVPKYRSEAHQWSFQQAGAARVAAFVTADGEEKSDEKQWDLVTDVDQVTQLAYYELYQRREGGPFTLPLKPHMRDYEPGDCLTLGADLGVHPSGAIKAVVRSTSGDPGSGIVTLEFEQETDAKHPAALSATGVAPAAFVPPTSEELDGTYYYNNLDPASVTVDSATLTCDTTGETVDAR